MDKISNLHKIIAFVLILSAAAAFSKTTIRSVAGTPALEAKITAVAARLDEKITKDRMDALQERMWKIEDRWAERYKAEHGEPHKTLDALLAYMSEEDRDRHRELKKEYDALKKKGEVE